MVNQNVYLTDEVQKYEKENQIIYTRYTQDIICEQQAGTTVHYVLKSDL